MLIDLRNNNLTGKIAEEVLGIADITINKNMVPFDPKSPFVTSGIRVGSPALTTRGMNTGEVKTIVELIDRVIMNSENQSTISSVKSEVQELCKSFPIYD